LPNAAPDRLAHLRRIRRPAPRRSRPWSGSPPGVRVRFDPAW